MSRFCKEAGFLRVEVGQYFVTKDTGDLTQFHAVACREYTLLRDDPASQPWMDPRKHENWACIGSHDQFLSTSNSELKFESVNQDVRISEYTLQSLASPQEEEAVPASSEVIAARSKAKAKPQPRESSGTTTIPFSERIWIDVVPSKQDFDSHNLSKRVINILRHNQRQTVQFCKIIPGEVTTRQSMVGRRMDPRRFQ